jgi:tetratricopeptide (TPR) repeat protein
MNLKAARTGRLTVAVFLTLAAVSAFAQSAEIDYNTYYQYPFSLGVEYQSLKPFGTYSTDYNVFELSALFRYPLPSRPRFQPLAQLGIIKFDCLDILDPERWDHNHFYGTLGMAYSSRFTKNFEVAADVSLGLSEAIFPNLDPAEPRGALGFLGSLGARISLDPSYNLSIDVHPNLKYLRSFSPLERFNGFILGIGFAVSYRFGEDPDAPGAIIRSIRFSELEVPPLFAAMQNYYVQNPLGRVTITNTEGHALQDVDFAFFQAGFMDSPTKLITISELPAGESRTIDLVASFNQQVFTTEGITPLTGEIIAEYISRNKAATQRFSLSYDLHDKTALTWDDDRKVAAFITPADSALRNYSSFIRQSCKDEMISGLSEELQTGMQVFNALTEIGCLYQVDPTSPFSTAQENTMLVDSISLPRDCLKRATGDCDDLTVLFCSVLETVGIETGYITVPGHIYAAFNTKVPSRDYKSVHPDSSMTLNVNGELWVPVEITMIGTDDFLSSWRRGIEQYLALEKTPELRNLCFTREAQKIYRPVGLRETDLGLQYGSKAAVLAGFMRDREKLVDSVLEDYLSLARDSGEKRNYNKLGIACARFGRHSQAEKAFNTALSLDRNYLSPRINLGNVAYLRQEYQDALRYYHGAEKALLERKAQNSPAYLNVLLNISKAYYELENYDRATVYFEQLVSLDPSMAERFTYLSSSGGDTRAARIGGFEAVLYSEEEE